MRPTPDSRREWAPDVNGEPDPVVLREAMESDAPAMANVHAASFAESWSANEILELAAGPGGFALVLEEGGFLAGFLLARVIAADAEILTLAVDRARRGRGLGRRLVEAATLLAGRFGASAIFLEVAVDNAPALALYGAAGFVEAGFRPRYYHRGAGERADARVLRRDLTP